MNDYEQIQSLLKYAWQYAIMNDLAYGRKPRNFFRILFYFRIFSDPASPYDFVLIDPKKT